MSIYSSIYRCINILTGESYVGYDSNGGKHYSAIPVTIDNVYFSCKKEACEKLKISKHQLNKILSSYL
jgi:hypothetical protein